MHKHIIIHPAFIAFRVGTSALRCCLRASEKAREHVTWFSQSLASVLGRAHTLKCAMRNIGFSRIIHCLLGARVRYSAHDKGHEEGGSTYAKVGSSFRSPPGNSRASTPKTRVCLLYCFVLSPLTLRGAVPHHHLAVSEKELTYSSS